MSKYITHLDVSTTEAEEQNLQTQGFKKISADLNAGAGGNYVYIWYKKDSSSAAITRVQVTFNDKMGDGLRKAGYTQIMKTLNAGIRNINALYLWYFRGSTEYDTAIVDMDVTTNPDNEARKFEFGWERLTCDLNRKARGNWIHIWVKREKRTYICDLYVTDSFGVDSDLCQEGYIRVDEDTNRGADGAFVFIWYRQTTDREIAITDVEISTSDKEYETYQQQGYKSVSVNLNERTRGNKVYLWYNRNGDSPVRAISLLLNPDVIEQFKKAGIKVLKGNLNEGNSRGFPEYLCVKQ